jgi:hypothetical protein
VAVLPGALRDCAGTAVNGSMHRQRLRDTHSVAEIVLGSVAFVAIVGLFVSAGMVLWMLPLAVKVFGYSVLTLLAVLLAAKVID